MGVGEALLCIHILPVGLTRIISGLAFSVQLFFLDTDPFDAYTAEYLNHTATVVLALIDAPA